MRLSGSRCHFHEAIDVSMMLWVLKNLFRRGISAKESKTVPDGGIFSQFQDLLGPKISRFKVLTGV